MNGTLASGVTLTTTPTLATNTAKCRGAAKHSIDISWTPGVSGNILTVLVLFRADIAAGNASWIQSHTWSASAGAKTRTNDSYTLTASGTSEHLLSIPIVDKPAQEYTIKYSEDSSGGAGKGTITAYWTSC